ARADRPSALSGRVHRRGSLRVSGRSVEGRSRRGHTRRDRSGPLATHRRPRSPARRRVAVRQYLNVLGKALEEGDERADRTGIGTRAVFGEMMRFDLSAGFPAVTTKRLAFRSVVAELLWFLAGSSDVNDLHALGVHIWDGNAFADYWRSRARFPGDAGRNYGQQWRDWIAPDGRHIDQLRDTIRLIREQPASRRMLVNAWNPGELELEPHEFVHVLADAHVYRDHVDAAREQLEREPYPAPTLWLDPELRGVDDAVARYREIVARAKRGEAPGPLLDGFAKLLNYQHHPPT